MNERRLKQWLQASDVTATEPALPPLDADHLERLVTRRRIRRRGFTAATTAALAFALCATFPDQTQRRVASTPEIKNSATAGAETPSPDVKVLLRELEAMQREIDKRRAMVAALRQVDERERLQAELTVLQADAPPEVYLVRVRIRQVRDEAAATSLVYAHALATEFEEVELAEAEYRKIASRYPGTVWSSMAEQAIPSAADSF